jgi:DNA polymerase sigma
VTLNPNLLTLLCRYRLVKAWAAAHGLNDAAANTLNSWSLGLLVAFYLQVLGWGVTSFTAEQ